MPTSVQDARLNYVPRRAAPPTIPPGWRVGPPDFVGVGTMRSGTTWWWKVLCAHPQISLAPGRGKEVHYFDAMAGVRPFSAAGYHAHFPRPEGARTGEWTPRYLHDWWTPPMLAAAAGDARLLVLLRDPVARFVSGLAHQAGHGVPPHPTLLHDQFERGLYWNQLSRLTEYFPREQILVQQYERCRADPATEAARVHAFLGLDTAPPLAPELVHSPVNRSPATGPTLAEDDRRALVRAYHADAARLLHEFPDEIDPALWPTVAGEL